MQSCAAWSGLILREIHLAWPSLETIAGTTAIAAKRGTGKCVPRTKAASNLPEVTL